MSSYGSGTMISQYSRILAGDGLYGIRSDNGRIEYITMSSNGSGTMISQYSRILAGDDNTYIPNQSATFDANGGSIISENSSYSGTPNTTASTSTVSRDYYTFVGWSRSSNGLIVTPIYDNSTYYAIWTPTTYSISYNLKWKNDNDLNDSLDSDGNRILNSTFPTYYVALNGTAIPTIGSPKGYTLLEWTPTNIASYSTSEKTIVGTFARNWRNVTIKFDNGTSDESERIWQYERYGTSADTDNKETDDSPLPVPKKKGHSFKGYKEHPNDTVIINNDTIME